jgi:CCR4-NOT complex subunit CAF16
MDSEKVVNIKNLVFAYPRSKNPTCDERNSEGKAALKVDEFSVTRGARVVICGPNGAGKSSLLGILGGKRFVLGANALVLGRECFNDCSLSERVCVLSDWWRTDFFLDVTVRAFLGERIVNSKRCESLREILQVDLDWRISHLSDGQRRRCQILAAVTASENFELYILDEVTADLDIVSRERFLEWLKRESHQKGITVLYSTHILDGMGDWATRLVYMDSGEIQKDYPITAEINVFSLVRGWMLGNTEIS